MSARMQFPLSQRRHTNIAVIRYSKNGVKLEIACYKNKVVSYRSGIENRLDEVLQVDRVFTSVSRGHVASEKDIAAVFGPDVTEQAAIQYMLQHGELQIAQHERNVEVDELFKDIAFIIAGKCVNCKTQRPFPSQVIEQALRASGLNAKVDQPPKKQALQFMKVLMESQIIPIGRAAMRLRCLTYQHGVARLEQWCTSHEATVEEEKEVPASTALAMMAAAAAAKEDAKSKERAAEDDHNDQEEEDGNDENEVGAECAKEEQDDAHENDNRSKKKKSNNKGKRKNKSKQADHSDDEDEDDEDGGEGDGAKGKGGEAAAAAALSTITTMTSFLILTQPHLFRDLDRFVKQSLPPGSSAHVVESAVHEEGEVDIVQLQQQIQQHAKEQQQQQQQQGAADEDDEGNDSDAFNENLAIYYGRPTNMTAGEKKKKNKGAKAGGNSDDVGSSAVDGQDADHQQQRGKKKKKKNKKGNRGDSDDDVVDDNKMSAAGDKDKKGKAKKNKGKAHPNGDSSDSEEDDYADRHSHPDNENAHSAGTTGKGVGADLAAELAALSMEAKAAVHHSDPHGDVTGKSNNINNESDDEGGQKKKKKGKKNKNSNNNNNNNNNTSSKPKEEEEEVDSDEELAGGNRKKRKQQQQHHQQQNENYNNSEEEFDYGSDAEKEDQ